MLNSLDRGRRAFAQRAWKEAYACLSEADGDALLEGRDLEMLATAAYLVGNDEASEAAWTRAYEWLSTRDRRRAARTAFWLVLQLLAIGDWARGGGWLSTAERLLDDDTECPERGLLMALVARTHAKHGDLAAASDAFTGVAARARTSDDPELRAFSLLGLAVVAAGRRENLAAMKLFDEAMVAVTTDALSPISAGVIYCAVIEACHDIFDVARAREWTAALSRWCADQPDLLPFRGHCLVHRAETMRLTGDWVNAIAEAARVVSPEVPIQSATTALRDHRTRAYPIGAAFYEMAEIHRMRGRFGDAEEAYRQAHLYGRSPDPGLARLRLAQGRVDAAAAAIRRTCSQRQKPAVRAGVLAACVDIMLAAHAHDEARAAADELTALAEGTPAPYLRALSGQASGAIQLAENKPRDALDALRAAWVEWQALEIPYEAACARVAMGLSWRELGDAEAAELEFDAARRVFLRLEAAPDVERVNTLLVAASQSTGRSLTPRELQVIRLIAAGESNRVIAGELSISERTVDRHVSNILTKLELPSRAAATAYAYEHGLVP